MKQRLVFVLAALALACSEPNTQVIVIVDAQPGVRVVTGGLQINIYGDARGEDMEAVPDMERHHSVVATSAPFAWPRHYVLTPENRDSTRLYRFEAIARRGPNESDEQLVVARVISGYQRGRTVTIYLLLADSCIGVPCTDPDTTCDPFLRMCVDARRDEDNLPPFVADGGVPDSGIPIERCSTSAQCDDGIPCTDSVCTTEGTCATAFFDNRCTGAVPCATGLCTLDGCVSVPNDALCHDSLDCTVDTCDGEMGCVFTPNDALCDDGTDGMCDMTNGCQYSMCTSTNCRDDDCFSAACDGTTCVRTPKCTGGAFCCGGACTCDDGNPCTDDSCPVDSCVHAANFAPCSDNNVCTDLDRCSARMCMSGTAAACGSECRSSVCNPVSGCQLGNPINQGGSCDNGGGCGGDYCSAGECQEGACPDGGVPYDAGYDAGPPPYDAGQQDDAGYDAGSEAGVDAGSECSSMAECDDGMPCTYDYCATPPGVCGHMPNMYCIDCLDGTTCNSMLSETCCNGMCCQSGETCDGLNCLPRAMGCPGGCFGGRTCCIDGSGRGTCLFPPCPVGGPDAGP